MGGTKDIPVFDILNILTLQMVKLSVEEQLRPGAQQPRETPHGQGLTAAEASSFASCLAKAEAGRVTHCPCYGLHGPPAQCHLVGLGMQGADTMLIVPLLSRCITPCLNPRGLNVA